MGFIHYRIQKMRINAKDHMAQAATLDPDNPYFEVHVCPELGTLVSGGIEIFGTYNLKTFILKLNFKNIVFSCN